MPHTTYAIGRFRDADEVEFTGVVIDSAVAPLADVYPAAADLAALLADWSLHGKGLDAAVADAVSRWGERSTSVEELTVLAPHVPAQIFQSGANYKTHVVQLMVAAAGQAGDDDPEGTLERATQLMQTRADTGTPYVFLGLPSSICGPYDDVVLPDIGTQHDWELELAAVIGTEAFQVSRADAMSHVAGYLIVNDLTTRDRVFRPDMPGLGTDWLAGKNAPTFLPVGPWFVPARFVDDPADLAVTLSLNGQVMQDESTADMIFGIAQLIEYVSAITPMRPGDLLLTGSPAGNGAHYGRYLREGDVMESTITGLGVQRNTCVTRMRTVDVHAHVDVPAIMAMVQGQAGLAAEQAAQLATFGPESTRLNIELATTSYRPMLDDIEVRLQAMDAGGVDVQAVSVVPTLYHYWADETLGAEIAAAANEQIAASVAEAPDRLVGLANVTLQHAELAAGQLHDATERLGLRGVEISTSWAGRELSDRALDPFWAAAESLGSLVFIHPWGCSLGSRLAMSYLGNVVGNPTETTVALNHLVFGGVLDRFPGLTICAAHGGGYFPHYLARADHSYRVRPESRTMQREPSAYLDSLYFDSLIYSSGELSRLVQAVGADHVVIGTDYPFDMGVPDPIARLDAIGLPQDERDAVAGTTASRLLDL